MGGSETNVETPAENESCVYEGTAVGEGEEGDSGELTDTRNRLVWLARVSQERNEAGNDCVFWSGLVGRQWNTSLRWDNSEVSWFEWGGAVVMKRSLWGLGACPGEYRRQLPSRESELEVRCELSLMRFKVLRVNGPRGWWEGRRGLGNLVHFTGFSLYQKRENYMVYNMGAGRYLKGYK